MIFRDIIIGVVVIIAATVIINKLKLPGSGK